MAGPAEGLLRTPAFWVLSTEQKRYALSQADPRFKGLSPEHFSMFLVDKYPKYGPKAYNDPRDVVTRMREEVLREPPEGDPRANLPARTIRALGDLVLPGTLPEAVGALATLPIGGAGAGAMKGAAKLVPKAVQGLVNFGGGLFSGAATRTAAGATGAGATRLAQTGSPMEALGEAGTFAGRQALGEVLPGGVRAGLYAKKGAQATRAAADKNAFNQAMHKALTETEQAGHLDELAKFDAAYAKTLRDARLSYAQNKITTQEAHANVLRELDAGYAKAVAAREDLIKAQRTEHAEKGAAKVADAFKQEVPPWRDYPSNVRGLVDIVYGTGPEKLSKYFDDELKAAIAQGRGKTIALSFEDAMNLNIKTVDVQPGGQVFADAGDAILAVVGKWKEFPATYRRVTNSLVDLGVGNEEARAAYKAGQGLISFTDKTKMVTPPKKAEWVAEEVFHSDRAQAGLTQLKTVNELRRRGLGNALEGPLAEAVRTEVPADIPAVPQVIKPATPRFLPFQAPVKQPSPSAPQPRVPPTEQAPEGITTTQIPAVKPYAGGLAAAIPSAVMNPEGFYRHGTAFAAGYAASAALSGQKYTSNAPLASNPTTAALLDMLLRVEPLQAGQSIQEALRIIPPLMEPGGLTLTVDPTTGQTR